MSETDAGLGRAERTMMERPSGISAQTRDVCDIFGDARMRMLAAEHGADWDAMSEAERDRFLISLLDNHG